MNTKYITLVLILLINNNILSERSIHRTQDPEIGSISVHYENDPETFHLKSSYLRELPLFKSYNHEYFLSKKLPDNVSFRYEPEKSVKRDELEAIIKNLLEEIKQNKKTFTDFKTLKRRDFNKFTHCGLLVLKFNKYPFILKLFIENPKSFVKPLGKSFQVRGVFILGGTFRHVTGYTRIRNLDLIKEKMNTIPNIPHKINFPRKFFWLPEKIDWIVVKGKNLGDKQDQETRLPSMYAVICDEIKSDEKKTIKRGVYLNFCSNLEFILDPNPSNYKQENGDITLIDTEHFSTLIGLNKKLKHYDKYTKLMPKIAGKYLKDRWASCKEERRERQGKNNTFPLFND